MKKIEVYTETEIKHPDWWSFVKYINENKSLSHIFRGHSNYAAPDKFNQWKIQSSFNRNYPNRHFHTETMEALLNMQEYASLYRTESIKFNPKELSILEMMQFLQHYGIPTPLIDFTTDPLTALYFAVSGIPAHASAEEEFEKEERYITIVQLDVELIEEFPDFNNIDDFFPKGKNLKESDITSFSKEYEKRIKKDNAVYGLVTTPNIIINPNLRLQNGLFIYFDSQMDFIEGFDSLIKIKFPEKDNSKVGTTEEKETIEDLNFLIKLHHIPYKSLFFVEKNNCINIAAYLMRNNKIGVNLFENDIQGLRYDLHNGDIAYTLGCINKQLDCNCLRILDEKGIL